MFNSFEFRNIALTIINFHDLEVNSRLKNKTRLKFFLRSLFQQEKVKVETVDIIFCNDRFLKNLNKKFLNHNYNTDTVTFILSPKNESIISEGYLSVETIKQNALEFKVSYQNELIRVILHSCLHMAGYSDESKYSGEKMLKKEEFYLTSWLRFT